MPNTTGVGLNVVNVVNLIINGGSKMKLIEKETEKPSFWQLVFAQSKVNGAPYNGEQLPGCHWDWPKDTYLQRKLRQSRWDQSLDETSGKADLN
jgi:hypothetical protein